MQFGSDDEEGALLKRSIDRKSVSLMDRISLMANNRYFVTMKVLVGTFFRMADTALDIVACVKFSLAHQYEWALLVFIFLFPSGIVQYIMVKFEQGWEFTCWQYLIPCSVHHVTREVHDFFFLWRLPQSSLNDGLHEFIGARVMNTALAGVECLFESFPQALIQLRALYVLGGNWVNYLSMGFSFMGIAAGVGMGIMALMKQGLSGSRYVNDPRQSNVSLRNGKVVLFDKKEFSTNTIEALAWFANTDRNIADMGFNDTNLDDEKAKILLMGCPALKSLQFNNTNVTDDSIKELATHCTELHTLWLASTRVSDHSMLHVAKYCTKLRSVNLEFTSVTDDGYKVLFENCSEIDSLYLDGSAITDKAFSLVACYCPQLFYLSLGQTQIGDESMIQVAQYCQKLTKMGLSATRITNKSAIALAAHNKCLENVVFRGTAVGDDGVIAVVQAISTLRLIWVSSTSVTDTALREVAQHCRNLISFKVDHTVVSESSVVSVAKGCPKMETLDLSSVGIGNNGLSAVARACPKLTVLMLNDCTAITDEGVVATVKACSGLKHVELNRTSISDHSLEVAVKQLPKLLIFKCDGTQITEAGRSAATESNAFLQMN